MGRGGARLACEWGIGGGCLPEDGECQHLWGAVHVHIGRTLTLDTCSCHSSLLLRIVPLAFERITLSHGFIESMLGSGQLGFPHRHHPAVRLAPAPAPDMHLIQITLRVPEGPLCLQSLF